MLTLLKQTFILSIQKGIMHRQIHRNLDTNIVRSFWLLIGYYFDEIHEMFYS